MTPGSTTLSVYDRFPLKGGSPYSSIYPRSLGEDRKYVRLLNWIIHNPRCLLVEEQESSFWIKPHSLFLFPHLFCPHRSYAPYPFILLEEGMPVWMMHPPGLIPDRLH